MRRWCDKHVIRIPLVYNAPVNHGTSRTHSVQVRLSEGEMSTLQTLAAKRGLSRASYLRMLLLAAKDVDDASSRLSYRENAHG